MAIIQCENKHFYDDKRHESCPHCARGANLNAENTNNSNVSFFQSVSAKSVKFEDLEAVKNASSNIENAQKTVGLFMMNNNMEPVSGWLVGIEGENRGRSFEIHINNNLVGRSMKNDIKINDEHISREKHFVITYDPKSNRFFVTAGAGLTYLNGDSLFDSKEIFDGDVIEAGKSKYVFVAFCKDGRNWNEDEKDESGDEDK